MKSVPDLPVRQSAHVGSGGPPGDPFAWGGEGFFRSLVENALDIIYVIGADGIIHYINPSVERLLGYTPSELVGQNGWQFVHPGDLPGAQEVFAGPFRRPGEPRAIEMRLRHKNGSWRTFEVTGTHPPGRTDPPVLIVNSHDVTERRRIEAAFELNRLYLEQLFESAPEGIVLLDIEDRVLRANSEFMQIFGYTLDDILGRRMNDLIVPEELHDEASSITDSVRTGAKVTAETMRQRKDGALIHVSILGCPIHMEDGQVGIYGIYRDISDRKRMERKHLDLLEREREARARSEAAERRSALLAEVSTLLNASLDYQSTLSNLARLTIPALADYCLIDEMQESGNEIRRIALAHVNPDREKLLYRSALQALDDDARQHPVIQVVRTGEPLLVREVPDELLDAIAHNAEHRAGLRTLGIRSFIIVPLIARGRTLGAITLVAAESGRRYGPADLALAREVAERAALAVDNARLYRNAQQAIQVREKVLAFVSHDLRNPLATILLNASSILDSIESAPVNSWLREQLHWIERSTEQMNRLIEDLLDVARIEAGRLAVERLPVGVAPLLSDVLEMLRPLVERKSIRLDSSEPAGRYAVMADRERVLQVFSNLVGNAIKFTSEGGTITLAAVRTEGWIRFSVADTGCGIEEGHLPHLFDQYWQARRTARAGAGLGLAISRGIIEAHGGRVWVESEAGRGSIFFFTLPED